MLPGERRDGPQDGRAIDIKCSVERGHEIADFLLAKSATMGVILIIHDRTQWGPGINGGNPKVYTGSSPHTDHVHAELHPRALLGLTEWFNGKVSSEQRSEYERIVAGDQLLNGDVSFQDPTPDKTFPTGLVVGASAVALAAGATLYKYG